MSDKVSIVIPAFNAEKYISHAIEAALSQTYLDLEILIVDDGSTDATATVVRTFHDSRVRYIYQSNSGQSAAVNRGAVESTGDYIKLLDADDWISPNHIEAQLKAIEGHEGCVASCRWGYFANDFHQPVVQTECTNKDYDDPLDWLVDSFTKDEGMMGGWMWLIPRPVWDKAGGYDERLSLNNDFHFSIAVLLASNGVRHSQNSVYSYRKAVDGALSASTNRKAMESALLTTQLGTDLLLQRSNCDSVRRIAADRFQQWLFKFYPAYPDLAAQAEKRIDELGGSDLSLHGGRLLNLLLPVLGWHGVRRMQHLAYMTGWRNVLQRKAAKRVSHLK